MRESRTPPDPPKGAVRRLLDLGRRALARIFGRKKKNPNIYPLY